jgi:GT2 family glycosyltransferase
MSFTAWFATLRRWLWLRNRRRLRRRELARALGYMEWCRRHDQPDASAMQDLRGRVADPLPRLTLHMAMDGATPAALQATLDSLQTQLHADWQLRLTGSGASAVLDWARQAQARDARVLAGPGAMPPAPWQGCTRPGDVWRPHALLLLAQSAGRDAATRLVYADHDTQDASGVRRDPVFKCDWNPELLWSHDFIGRAAFWRVAEAQPGPDGTHDFALRAAAALADDQVRHVPHVLLHCADPALDADTQAVGRHLARRGIAGECEHTRFGVRVRLALPARPPRVSLIIPTRNGLHLLQRCMDTLLRLTDYPDFEVVVIDNGSDDPACLRYLHSLAADARVRVRRDDGPFNFAALNNAAVADCRGGLLAFVNNDIEVIDGGWLREMASLALLPGIGAVGARLLYADRTLQHAGVILGIQGTCGHGLRRLLPDEGGYLGRARRLMGLSAVTAACLVVQREHFLRVGGFDAEHFAVAFNDVDLCLRLRAAGLRNLYTPHAVLVHHELSTRGSDGSGPRRERFLRERDAFRARWAALLDADPAYNPNLTLNDESFGLADPPRAGLW